MTSSEPARTESRSAKVRRLAVALARELVPKVLFFFCVFLLIFGLFALFVQQYSVHYVPFARAAIAALVLGKLVPLLDWAGSRHHFTQYRRVVVIAVKTLAYALVVIAFGILEEVVKADFEEGSLRAALHAKFAHVDGHRFLGLVLLLSLVIGVYLTIQAIDKALGEGTFKRVLLGRHADDRK